MMSLPLVGKIISIVVSVLILIIMLFFSASCGVTKVRVVNSKDNPHTSVTVTTNNPTSVETSPDVDVSLNLKSE